MKTKRARRVRSITINPEAGDAFTKKYPMMMSRFCEKAVFLALTDKDFFEKVYFGIKDKDVKEFDYGKL